jgi:biopolymer transport protein ExbD
MSVSIEPPRGQGARSVDVELNLVPFIDMMSCLVAFLLLAAVWTNIAQIRVNPRAAGAASTPTPPEQVVAVLITPEASWVGRGESVHRVGNSDGARDWAGFDAALAQVGPPGLALQLAAEPGVDFQTIVAAMDHALAQGVTEIAYVDASLLSVRFAQ